MKSTLYTNSFLIMLSSGATAICSFIFWILAAKLYPKEDVGFATAVISSIALILLISRLGLDQSMIKYFPIKGKNNVFGISVVIQTLISVLLGIIFVLGINIWSPKLSMINNFVLLFLILLTANSILNSLATTFFALRDFSSYLFQNILLSSRVLFIGLFAIFGVIGIFISFSTGVIIALSFSILALRKYDIRLNRFDIDYLREATNFSISNYIVSILTISPNYILPIMVLNILGPIETAHYFIAFSIASIIFMFSDAISISLFVEGSNFREMKFSYLKPFLTTLTIEIGCILFIFSFGDSLLKLFGEGFTEGFGLLKLLSLSSVFVIISYIDFSKKKIEKDNKGLVMHGTLIFILILGLSYALMSMYGIMGIGYAWILGYGFNSLIIIMNMISPKSKRLFSFVKAIEN